MNAFYLLVEISIYVFAFFLLLKKGELSIIYLPVLVFAESIIIPTLSASFFYIVISIIIIFTIAYNPSYIKNNIYSFLLVLYFFILLPNSSDLVLVRPNMFRVIWLFTFIPIVCAVYKKYSKEVIFKELGISSTIILVLFICNVLLSTLKGFSPHEMYNISSGILYGNIFGASFNVISIAIFINTLKTIEKKNLIYFLILFLALTFILLSLRRSVMAISLIGLLVAYLTLLSKEKANTFITIAIVTVITGFTIYTATNFATTFNERYELRKLDERGLDQEKRFEEYGLVLDDMFTYNKYSPWFGFELFNSWGNYGKGVLEERSLHGDLTSIAHSSGLIGVGLYILMVLTAFTTSLRAVSNRLDKMVILFCGIAFVVYTITGRYTAISSTMLFYLVLMLPVANKVNDSTETDDIDLDNFDHPFQLDKRNLKLN